MPAHDTEQTPGGTAPAVFGAGPGPAYQDTPPSYQSAPSYQDIPASGGAGAGHYDAPGSSDVADALGASDDGLPGGPAPASSGFSWRVGGGPAPVMHSQGGIPNEFDHLFRDSDSDGRRSLMPPQPPVSLGPPQPRPAPPARPVPGQYGATEPQLPVYAPPPADGYPPQPYAPQAYGQQPSYQAAVGVGAPDSTSLMGAAAGPDDHSTQAIPRVQVDGYGGSGGGEVRSGGYGGGSGRNSTTTMLIAGGVFVVLIIIAVISFSGGGDSDGAKKGGKPAAVDTPTTSANGVDPAVKAQADALYQVIGQSKGLTGKASAAIDAVAKCQNVADAQATFNEVAGQRQAQADAVKNLPVDKVPGGEQLKADMAKAWQFSADSERSLAAWAGDNLTCSGKPTNNSNRSAADGSGGKAGSAKVSVASEWNAMAAQAGQPTIKKEEL